MSSRFSWMVALLACLLCSIKTHAEVVFGIDALSGDVAVFDLVTGAPTVVSNIGDGISIGGATHDPLTDTTYFIGNGDLMTLDRFTGAVGVATNLDRSDIVGLAFNADTGQLWGASSRDLFLINQSTGQTDLIGGFGLIATDLAYDRVTSTLFGLSNIENSLFRVDTSTGAATLADNSIGFQGPTALAIDVFGEAIATEFGGSLQYTQLLDVDLQSGEGTAIGGQEPSTLYRALFNATAIPEPTSAVLILAIAGVAFVRRGRRPSV
ncbi:MAG: PEP-CTERM sorting domain-containing protein [Planctomycetota bacterium]